MVLRAGGEDANSRPGLPACFRACPPIPYGPCSDIQIMLGMGKGQQVPGGQQRLLPRTCCVLAPQRLCSSPGLNCFAGTEGLRAVREMSPRASCRRLWGQPGGGL